MVFRIMEESAKDKVGEELACVGGLSTAENEEVLQII